MDIAFTSALDGPHGSPADVLRASQQSPDADTPFSPGYDLAINAESGTYRDGDELVSVLAVHTRTCPLIRAELRGEDRVRVLVYYPARTRLGLAAYEASVRDSARDSLGLRCFLSHVLNLRNAAPHLQDPALREMYLHEIIRRLAPAIAARRLESNGDFIVTRIV